jgi:exocyst complex component 2
MKGRYDVAMRDYKKGKMLLESRPGQLLPSGSSKDGQGSAAGDQQQKRILEKVWGSVEKAMGEMKNTLVSQLQDPTRSLEEQEKTIECVMYFRGDAQCRQCTIRILLDLQSGDDPVWTYFDSQHKHILSQMNKTYRSSVASIQCTAKTCIKGFKELNPTFPQRQLKRQALKRQVPAV